MRKAKGFGPPQKTQPFTVAILSSPAPGIHTVAIACKHGRFVATITPDGVGISNGQLAQINPGCLRWLAKNRNAIGYAIYSQPKEGTHHG